MKNTRNAVYLITSLILIQLVFSASIPIVKAEDQIADSYYQNLDFNRTYVYEVSQFGDSVGWYNFTPYPANPYEGDWKTNLGGQIRINLTGFYNKDSNDWGNLFEDPIPWYNIEIFENDLGTLNLNFSLNNRSNSEVARALAFGYNNFQPGFLIPKENLTYVKKLALNQSDPKVAFASIGNVEIEESYSFLYIGFEEIGGLEQKTYLIYEKSTGLLVWGKSSVLGYLLEIKSLNYTLQDGFTYNVIQFNQATGWYNLSGGFEGDWSTNVGGQIIANLTGYYSKDPNDWGNVIDDPIPWFDIAILENKSGILTTNFTIANRSNSELGWSFILGYNYFQPGFLIQIIDNITQVKKLAFQEATGFANGLVLIEEKPITIKITFEQTDGEQKTSLLYEKRTGLLLWAYTSIGDYLLEMRIEGYIPWESTGEELPLPPNFFLKLLPYIVIASIGILIMSGSLTVSKYKTGFKKYNKYVLIAILATASFSSFFVFTSSLEVGEVNEPLREVQDITLKVNYGNGTVTTWANFTLTDYNTTAYDALAKWCQVEITDYGEMGFIVESINDLKKAWLYSVNGEFPGVAANLYNLKDGDVIEFTSR